MLVHDNGKVNVLAENRCANTSLYNYFKIPTYSQMQNNSRQQLRSRWKSNPSEKIVVLRHPYQRIQSAINYHNMKSVDFYNKFKTLPIEEQKKEKFFWAYKDLFNTSYADFRKNNIVGHSIPYLHHLIGLEFRYIDFNRISEYVDTKSGPITNTVSTDFSVDFLEFYQLDDIKFEKRLYEEFLLRCEEISPEEWKEKTLTA